MISDSLVIEITKAFVLNDDELMLPDISKRKALMGLFSLLLANKVNPTRFSFFFNDDWNTNETSAQFIKDYADSPLANTVISDLIILSDNIWEDVTKRIEKVRQLKGLDNLDFLNSLTLYERVLHRLQEKAPKSPLQGSFPYQYWGEGFQNVLTALLPHNNIKNIYFPNAHRGELVSYIATVIPSATIYSESDDQSPIYIYQKLLIAGTENAKSYEISSLEQETAINPGSMDLTVTASITSIQSPAHSSLHRKELKGFFDPSRIDLDSLGGSPSKEFALMQQMLWALVEGGKGIIFVGKGPLQREKEAELRRTLLTSGAIDSVIKLGDKLLGGRSTAVYAVLITKRNKANKSIFFLDASDLFEIRGRQSYLRDTELLKSLITSRNNGVRVDLKKVSMRDAVLFPEFYLSNNTEVKAVDIEKLKLNLVETQKVTDRNFDMLEKLK